MTPKKAHGKAGVTSAAPPRMNLTLPTPTDALPPKSGAAVRVERFVRLFKPQFAPLVEAGIKTQTIRRWPKRMPKAGDCISLRMWTGKPYCSRQRILREGIITDVWPIVIVDGAIKIEDRVLSADAEWDLAKADGFNTVQDMFEWFNVMHGLPFTGILIVWSNGELTDPAHKTL